MLSRLPEMQRTARWYYLAAIANSGLGSQINALEYARKAASMEPDNLQYSSLVHQLESGGQWYQQRSDSFGWGNGSDMENCCSRLCMCLICGNCCGTPICCI